MSTTPIPEALRWEVWSRDNFTCKACGSRMFLVIDHVQPERWGGATVASNLQTLCQSCNSRKRDHITKFIEPGGECDSRPCWCSDITPEQRVNEARKFADVNLLASGQVEIRGPKRDYERASAWVLPDMEGVRAYLVGLASAEVEDSSVAQY